LLRKRANLAANERQWVIEAPHAKATHRGHEVARGGTDDARGRVREDRGRTVVALERVQPDVTAGQGTYSLLIGLTLTLTGSVVDS